MTLTDYAWAAGFVDGEGCIHIQRSLEARRTSSRFVTYKLTLGLTGRDRRALDRCAALFGGRVRPFRKRHYPEVSYYALDLVSDRACAALKLVLPHLINKAEIARLGIEFHEWYRATKTPTRTMPEFRRVRAQAYRDECLRLVRINRQPQGAKIDRPPMSGEEDRQTG
jgi:hypothetical protein